MKSYAVKRAQLAVPTTGTGALAEKAKTCKAKPTKGIRQVSPVASAEGVSIFVPCFERSKVH